MTDELKPLDPASQLLTEVGKIAWADLQRFYAQGLVLVAKDPLDLVTTALHMQQDDSTVIEGWLTDGALSQVSDDQAQAWFNEEQELWTIVLAPWVLVKAPKD